MAPGARPSSGAQARLEKLKALAGTWKGTAGHGDQESDATSGAVQASATRWSPWSMGS